MKIKKKLQSIGVVGRIFNAKSSSDKDTYSCDYLNDKINEVSAGFEEPINNEELWVEYSNNLFNPSINHPGSTTINGITMTTNNYEVSFSGTATAEEAQFDAGAAIKIPSYITSGVDKITISGGSSDCQCGIYFYNSNRGYIDGIRSLDGSTKTITIPSGTVYMGYTLRIPSGKTLNNYNPKFQMEYGDKATAYSPFINKNIKANINGNYETISRKNVYSTEEIVIGEWIDGKPIYRKVLTGKFSNDSSTSIDVCDNIKEFISFNGISYTANQYPTPLNVYYDSAINSLIQGDLIYGDLIIAHGSTFKNKPYKIVVEYTKTTD